MWGYFSSAGTWELVNVERKMGEAKYMDNLGKKLIFQQVNDSKHEAKATMELPC